MNLQSKIEALLFFKNAPLSRKDLAKSFAVEVEEINEAIVSLKESLKETGITVVEKEDEIMLGANPEMGDFLANLRKEELETDLSKASLETLTILLFKNGATRAEIDYIRGVNSAFILRILAARGLVEKTPHPTDSRKIIYKPTFDLLSYMGLSSVDALPDYIEVNKALNEVLQDSGQEKNQDVE